MKRESFGLGEAGLGLFSVAIVLGLSGTSCGSTATTPQPLGSQQHGGTSSGASSGGASSSGARGQQRLEHQRLEQQRFKQQRFEQQRSEQQRFEQQRDQQQRDQQPVTRGMERGDRQESRAGLPGGHTDYEDAGPFAYAPRRPARSRCGFRRCPRAARSPSSIWRTAERRCSDYGESSCVSPRTAS